ncbi:hypothetical protein ABEB36_007642 [Hypothenemus hampei]|uniref:Uncharacterized protein n=1 Tax=Hypothenemus hampei TaxID=57062 RepID=A0ABD1EV95_HYPHA
MSSSLEDPKDIEVNYKVFQIYCRITIYRPDLTEENCLIRVQKILKDAGINLTIEQITNIATHYNQPIMTKHQNGRALIKRNDMERQWSLKPFINQSKDERKRERSEMNEHFEKNEPMTCSTPTKIFEQPKKEQPPSRIPKAIFRKHNKDDTKSRKTSIFDRLYENRPKPCVHKLELVHYIRDVWTNKNMTNKRLPQTQHCAYHEPPSKRTRYSRNCLNHCSSSNVFDRLYAERKQVNIKKPTDIKEKETILRKQRQTRNKFQGKSDSILDNLVHNNSAVTLSDSTVSEISDMQTTLVPEYEVNSKSDNITNLLDLITQRFDEYMSICAINQSDLIEEKITA